MEVEHVDALRVGAEKADKKVELQHRQLRGELRLPPLHRIHPIDGGLQVGCLHQGPPVERHRAEGRHRGVAERVGAPPGAAHHVEEVLQARVRQALSYGTGERLGCRGAGKGLRGPEYHLKQVARFLVARVLWLENEDLPVGEAALNPLLEEPIDVGPDRSPDHTADDRLVLQRVDDVVQHCLSSPLSKGLQVFEDKAQDLGPPDGVEHLLHECHVFR
mmetsp:Transcript_2062/g.4878  ORF Transcript_2062/g.4878 Transcript_2062/m.4878 type:complete len:218 (-) Transcript_2062:765-1418(-)